MENAEAAGFSLLPSWFFQPKNQCKLINNSEADVLTNASHTKNTDNFSFLHTSLIFHSH